MFSEFCRICVRTLLAMKLVCGNRDSKIGNDGKIFVNVVECWQVQVFQWCRCYLITADTFIFLTLRYRGNQLIPQEKGPVWIIHSVTLETKANFTCQAVNAGGEGQPDTKYIDVYGKYIFLAI